MVLSETDRKLWEAILALDPESICPADRNLILVAKRRLGLEPNDTFWEYLEDTLGALALQSGTLKENIHHLSLSAQATLNKLAEEASNTPLHPGIELVLRRFTLSDSGDKHDMDYACHDLAYAMAYHLPQRAELIAGLLKLLEARECFRQAMAFSTTSVAGCSPPTFEDVIVDVAMHDGKGDLAGKYRESLRKDVSHA